MHHGSEPEQAIKDDMWLCVVGCAYMHVHVDAEREKCLLCCMYGAIKDIFNGGIGHCIYTYSRMSKTLSTFSILLVCLFIV